MQWHKIQYRYSHPSFLSPTSLTVLLLELFKCSPVRANRVDVLSSNRLPFANKLVAKKVGGRLGIFPETTVCSKEYMDEAATE